MPLAAFLLLSRQSRAKSGLTYWRIAGMLAELASGALGIWTSFAGRLNSQIIGAWPLSLTPTFLGPMTLIFFI